MGFWDIAYRDNAPTLLGVLRRYVQDTSVAQDLLHEVFITAIDKYDSYAGKGNFEAWLYRIAVNTALMYLRNEHNEQSITETMFSIVDDDTGDEHHDEKRTAIEAAEFTGEELLAAIDRLPEHHKLVFNMYVMDDFSHKQIAKELNISSGTSKSHLARARKKIQQFLYDDAMNKKKIKDTRRASAFMFLFSAKEHYIDKLYRTGLSDFTIPPIAGAEFLPTALEQYVASTALESAVSVVSQTAFWGSKMSYIAVCCGTAVITGTVGWLAMSEKSPFKSYNNISNSDYEIVTVNDSSIYSPTPTGDFDIISEAEVSESEQNNQLTTEQIKSDDKTGTFTEEIEPVVVRRQIIQRQTVVVRDTIFIIE